jgi:drug/metabolite transporter (DMT)-like permease
VGVAFLQLGGTSLFQFTDGDIFSMLQALFFGIGYWRLESVANRYQGQPGLLTVGQLVAVAVGSLGFWFTTSGLPDVSQLVSWLSNAFIAKTLIWTGLVSTALALYLETVALKAISATELTVLMTSISLWGSLFAWTWTGELLAQTGMVGGVMIVASCILWAVSPKSEKDAL